jgi:UDP-glucuronate 4-epimerase
LGNILNKKVLVTGAAGFIGFHLIEALVTSGYQVVGIDNLNDYYDINLKLDRLFESGIHKEEIDYNTKIQSRLHLHYSFIKLDITDLSKLEQLFIEQNFDIVINLAAQAGVRYSLTNPHAYVQSNLVGFANILECCRHHSIKHLLYASSSSVYGNNSKTPFSEDDNVDFPISLYAASKKANELMAHSYSHLYKLPTTGLRFFTVYGPWGRPDMAPTLFATSILKQNPIKVFNNGELIRDFTYIDDIIAGIIKTIHAIPNGNNEHAYYQLFNIGNAQRITLFEFINTLEKIMGKTTEKELLPMQPGDVLCTWADIEKLKSAIDFEPTINLHEGLSIFATWFMNYYKNMI